MKFIDMTQTEVIEEAKRRYPIGTHFQCINNNSDNRAMIITDDTFKYMENSGDGIHWYNYWILLRGKWAVVTKYPESIVVTNYEIY